MKRFTFKLLYLLLMLTIFSIMGFIGLYLTTGPSLPEVESIRKIRLQTPMSIFTRDGQLIAEFGDKRRILITLDQVPQQFIDALLATEDQRFYQHSGVDLLGVVRAFINLAVTQTKSQGASTITMLVARNYYLTSEKRFSRKITEMFLAWKIESELSKNEILELFLNKIPFGHRAFGIGSAAQVYYGTNLDNLSLAKLATLAGIPKGQSVYNPISYPRRAESRRAHVLGRMLTENHITQQEYEEALAEPIETTRHGARATVYAPYIAEMIRQSVIKQYGIDKAYSDGLKVYSSLDPKMQAYAQQALIDSLEEYDRRHGYRGAEINFPLINEDETPVSDEQIMQWLEEAPQFGKFQPAIVLAIDESDSRALIRLKNKLETNLILNDTLWARRYVDENNQQEAITEMSQVLKVGDIIQVKANPQFKPQELESQTEKPAEKQVEDDQVENAEFLLAQIPQVSGGFISLTPNTGAIEALVGGYNFEINQYNMVTQARRQLGSNIKPFIYSAAFEKQFTPASIINDMPIVEADITSENFWRPKNDSGNYLGPTRLRIGLRYSKNTISVRLMREIGAKYAKEYLTKVGFPAQHIPAYLSLALGSASFTPLEVVTGYAVLANGGYKVAPWFIARIEDSQGQIIQQHQPIQVCRQCEKIIEAKTLSETELTAQSGQTNKTESKFINLPVMPIPEEFVATRVIDERNLFLIDSILKDVIHRGTATTTLTRTKSPLLKRNDLAGKTGTTNESKDAWFSGYNTQHVATAWVGFNDHTKKLGKREFGGRAALPIWQKFMQKALQGEPQINHQTPEGIVTVKIDAKTGLLASKHTKNSMFEVFRSENAPTEYSDNPAEEVIFQEDEVEDDESLF